MFTSEILKFYFLEKEKSFWSDNTFFQVLQVLSLTLEKQTSKNVVVPTFAVFIIVVNNLLFTRPFQFENAPSGSLFLQLVDHVQDSFEKQNAKTDIRYSY